MSALTRKYVIYDFPTQRFIRSDSATDEVAFSKIAIGGVSGPVISEISGNFSIGGVKLVNVDTPTAGTDAANKDYVDLVAQGLLPKDACVVATTASDWTSVTITSGSGTVGDPLILANMPAGTTYPIIDGIQLALNDRILIKDFTGDDRVHNGLYYLSEAVSGTSAKFIRTLDADNSPESEFRGGIFTFITQGTLFADTGWVCSKPEGNVVTFTVPIEFVQFSSAGVIEAGDGLSKAGNIINVNPGDGIEIDGSNNVAVKLDGTTLSNGSLGLKVNDSFAGFALTITSNVMDVDSSIAGTGLTYSSGVINLNAADASILTTASDIKVQLDGTTLETTASGVKVNDSFAGLALTITSGVMNLDIDALAGDGLVVNSGSMIDVNCGSGLTTLDDKIKVTDGALFEDGTPKLSANLDVDDQIITTSVSNGNIVIEPNAYGAFALSSTGDARGSKAVDLQMKRDSTNKVASGIYAAIGGGINNRADAQSTTISGGESNVASGNNSTVAGGYSNTASGSSSTVGGGSLNTASGGASTVCGGGRGTASGVYSVVLGGYKNTASNNYSFAVGGGSATSADYDVVVGNNAVDASADNVHFRIAGDTGNVVIGRATNQAVESGATNTLELHTTASGAQSFYVGLKAPALASSSTYTLPTTYGSDAQIMKTDASGNLYWGDGIVYTETLTNEEGGTVTAGKVVYVSSEGKFKYVNAADTFLNEGTITGFTIAAINNTASGAVYTMPDARFVGTVTSNGELNGGFIIAAFDLPDACISTTSTSTTITCALPIGHGVIATDVVTVAGISGPIAGISATEFNTYQTVLSVTSNTMTFDVVTPADSDTTAQGGTAGTFRRHRLDINEPVFLSLTDGEVTQNISNFVTGNNVVKLGYARGDLEFHFAPEYVIQL